MTDDTQDADRLPKHSKWRMFKREDSVAKQRKKEENAADVIDFLKPSTSKATPSINVAAAQRWPGTSQLLAKPKDNDLAEYSLSTSLPSSLRGSGVRQSRPRSKTLTVGFIQNTPEVIGEGGDESEVPPIEISRRRVAAARAAKAEGRKMAEWDIGRSMTVSHRQTDRPSNAKRPHTSWGEISPGLSQRSTRPRSPPPKDMSRSTFATIGDDEDDDDDDDVIVQPQRQPTDTDVASTHIMSVDDVQSQPTLLKRAQTRFSKSTPRSLGNENDDPRRLPELITTLSTSPDASTHSVFDLDNHVDQDSPTARARHQLRTAENGSAMPQPAIQKSFVHEDDPSSPIADSNTLKLQSPPSIPGSSVTRTHPTTRSIDPASWQENAFHGSQHSKSPSFGNRPSDLAPPPLPHATSLSSTDSAMPSQTESHNRSRPPMNPPVSASGHRMDPVIASDNALDDFASRVESVRGVFSLTVQTKSSFSAYAPMAWLRAAIWWFLKARSGLEVMIRNRPRGQNQSHHLLTQAHVDLAKAWWILTELTAAHPKAQKYNYFNSRVEAARAAGDEEMAEVFEVHEAILNSLKGLLISVIRNNVMPPQNALIQGQDQTIWVDYPSFTPDVEAVLGGKSSSIVVGTAPRTINPRSVMPLGDTKDDFCYGRFFVNVGINSEDGDDFSGINIPAVLTILRSHSDWNVRIAICSQTDLLTCAVHGDAKKGITWNNVRWKTSPPGLNIRLPRNFFLTVSLEENDYRMLRGIWDHARQVEASMKSGHDELCVHEVTVNDLQYRDPQNTLAFPPDRVKHCKVCVFEKSTMVNEGTGQRKLHRGYRLLFVTSPRSKVVSSVNHEFTGKKPLVFEFRPDSTDANIPLMVLSIKEDDKRVCSAIISFNDIRDRIRLFQVLNGLSVGPDEFCSAQVSLKGYLIKALDTKGVDAFRLDFIQGMQWQDIKVLNMQPDDPTTEEPQTILSEELRIVTRHSCGSITDRVNLGPGEMLVRLDNSGNPDIHLLRYPQDDATAAVDAMRAKPNVPDVVTDFLLAIKKAPTVRTYQFENHEGLHKFQKAVTGFTVRYDGIATTLAISRRRMVVPIYKRWEAQVVRLQIIQQANNFQFCAYMEDFSHADTMNFPIKSMDVLEKIELKGSKGEKGRFGLRMVDAKFWLPPERKKENGHVDALEQEKRRFACLDLPEYPGEHDDITIGFETEAERDRFSDALPAATQHSKFTLRRKI